jgi:hypothetical protein
VLTPADRTAKFGYPAITDVEVQDGRNVYVMANFPESHLVGEVLISGRTFVATYPERNLDGPDAQRTADYVLERDGDLPLPRRSE